MSGLLFKDAQPAATSSPNRADVVCFIGFVGRRRLPVPASVSQWLRARSWPALPVSLRTNPQLYPARISSAARAWLLASGWPSLPPNVQQLLQASVEPFAGELIDWLRAENWPRLSPSLLANQQLDATPITPATRSWLLANGWSIATPSGLPALDLIVSGETWTACSPLPERIKTWLQENGWRPRGVAIRDDDPLLNTPVPLESFEAFDRLFSWETRPPLPRAFPYTTWLGAAVRSFFRQGGARCFVTRIDDPGTYVTLAANATPAGKLAFTASQNTRLGQLLPGFIGGTPPSPADPATWKGLGVLFGLDEAAFVCLPDLPELVADTALEPEGLDPVDPGPESFVDCAPEIELPKDESRQISSSPACSEAGYLVWRRAVRHAARFLRERRRDVELVLTLPLPSPDLTSNYTRNLDLPSGVLGLGKNLDETGGIASAFVQLAYPWLLTPGSETLPGGIEPPDGVFSGVLARAIPELGVAHSIGRQLLRGVHGFEPDLPGPDFVLDTPKGAAPALIHRVSLLGRTPDAVRVLSDVTTSTGETHRPASVGRLTAAILRTSRELGDSVTFEPSGEALWEKIRTSLNRLLSDFYAAGALYGNSAADAYSIRCDATTTTQNDLDNGRVIAEVRFAPAHPVGLITVVLSLREGTVTAVGSPT